MTRPSIADLFLWCFYNDHSVTIRPDGTVEIALDSKKINPPPGYKPNKTTVREFIREVAADRTFRGCGGDE
jgi:hypothetical protein